MAVKRMSVKRTRIGFLLQPWAGLAGGVAGWFGQHQVIGDALHFDCGVGNPASTALAGLLAIAVIAAGALWSRAVLREGRDATEGKRPSRAAGSRPFVAILSLMAAALLALLVIVQTMAGLMLPGCAP